MNIQHFLTLSIDAIALSYAALMAANFVLGLLEEWEKGTPKSLGVCAEVLKPIFDTPDFVYEQIADPWTLPVCQRKSDATFPVQYSKPSANVLLLLPSGKSANNLVQLNIRQLKKKASAAKVKNYNIMTKAQLIEALSA